MKGPLNAGVMNGIRPTLRSISVKFQDSGKKTLKSSRKNTIVHTQRFKTQRSFSPPAPSTEAAGRSCLQGAKGQMTPALSPHSAQHPSAMAENTRLRNDTSYAVPRIPGGRACRKHGDPERHRGTIQEMRSQPAEGWRALLR